MSERTTTQPYRVRTGKGLTPLSCASNTNRRVRHLSLATKRRTTVFRSCSPPSARMINLAKQESLATCSFPLVVKGQFSSNCGNEIFLTMVSTVASCYNQYSNEPIDERMLKKPPGQRVYYELFDVMLTALRPDWQSISGCKPDPHANTNVRGSSQQSKAKLGPHQLILSTLKYLGYPYHINPSTLLSVSSSRSWVILLHTLYWLASIHKIIVGVEPLDFITRPAVLPPIAETTFKTPVSRGKQTDFPSTRRKFGTGLTSKTLVATPTVFPTTTSQKDIRRHLELLKRAYITRHKHMLSISQLIEDEYKLDQDTIVKRHQENIAVYEELQKRLQSLQRNNEEMRMFKEMDETALQLHASYERRKQMLSKSSHSKQIVDELEQKFRKLLSERDAIAANIEVQERLLSESKTNESGLEVLRRRRSCVQSTYKTLLGEKGALMCTAQEHEAKFAQMKYNLSAQLEALCRGMGNITTALMTTDAVDDSILRGRLTSARRIRLGDVLQILDNSLTDQLVRYKEDILCARSSLQTKCMTIKTKLCEQECVLQDLLDEKDRESKVLQREKATLSEIEKRCENIRVTGGIGDEEVEKRMATLRLEILDRKTRLHELLMHRKSLGVKLRAEQEELEKKLIPYAESMTSVMKNFQSDAQRELDSLHAVIGERLEEFKQLDDLEERIEVLNQASEALIEKRQKQIDKALRTLNLDHFSPSDSKVTE